MEKVKKGKELPNTIIPGQISIFDIDVTELQSKKSKIEDEISVQPIFVKNDFKLAEPQERFLQDKKILEDKNTMRVLIYSCGHIGIEVVENDAIKTIIYDQEAKVFTEFNREINITAVDKIYYSSIKYGLTYMQLKKLEELKSKFKSYKFIKRFGDRNIIVLHENGVSSINPKGWLLDYVSINNIEYTTEDILEEKLESKEDNKETCENVEYKIGDKILVDMLTRKVTGEVAHIYNSGESICFVYDNKYTATHISRIKKIA